MDYSLFIKWAWAIYLIILIIWIIMDERPIVTTIGWILALAFIPYLGFILYYYIGPQRINRHQENVLFTKKLFQQTKNNDLESLQNKFARLPSRSLALSKIIYQTSNYNADIAYNFQLISGGTQSYEQIFNDVSKAKNFILLEYYIYDPGTIGDQLLNLLIEKLTQGVKVYLLVDAVGSYRFSRKYASQFIKAGGKLAYFHSNSVFPNLQRFRPEINMRNHRKILICDAQLATTGGVNISDQQDLRIYSHAYHDLNVRFCGPAVLNLTRIFMEDWHYTTGENITHLLTNATPISTNDSNNGSTDNNYSLIQVFPSGPDNEATPLLHTILTIISQAEQRIWITSPYFIPTEQVSFALISAALRGLDVRIIVPEQVKSRLINYAARACYDKLFNNGVKIYLYPASNLIHSKSILFDQCCMLGTANFDNRSFMLNFEVNLINFSPAPSAMLEQQLLTDMQRSKIFNQSYLKRNYFTRFLENTARLASPLL